MQKDELGTLKIDLNIPLIKIYIDEAVEHILNDHGIPRVLSIDIKDVKRITGINSNVTLQKILSDPRILQHQFRLGEGGPRHWNAKGFEQAYEQVMEDLKMLY